MNIKLHMRLFNAFLVLGFLYLGSCTHDGVTNTDPGNPGGPMDTTNNPGGNPCDPNKVYFTNQVLPLLLSNCALSGCHDAISKEDGVVLNSFDNVIRTGDIDAFDPGGSKLYRVITESDPEERMPPPPMNALSAEQKKLIYDWIKQGAKNETCDQNSNCDLTSVSFANEVSPVISNNCKSCHSGASPLGGISLAGYNEIRTQALNGKLVCVINWNAGCSQMPKGGQKLNACSIDKIEAWVQQGSQNN